MRAVRRVMVLVREDTRLRSRPMRDDESGEIIAWLEVGENEIAVWGKPQTLRRLAREAVVAAQEAEELSLRQLGEAVS